MIELFIALAADLLLVVFAILVLKRDGTFWHPLFIYLFFHIYSVTLRIIDILNGAQTMYSESSSFTAITIEEILRALIYADIALFSFTLLSYFSGRYCRLNNFNKDTSYIPFSKKIAYFVFYISLPFGVLSMYLYRSEVVQGGYFATTAQWPIFGLCMLLFVKGFRWYLLLPIILYLSYVVFQGFHRFMFVLPVLFITCVYLIRNKRNWPPLKLSILALLFIATFPQLKYIGKAVQESNFDEVVYRLELAFSGDVDNSKFKGQFLDQLAGALTLTDQANVRLYGESYLSVLTLPIPRSLWPEKPGLGDHIIAVATPDRPYHLEGRIITHIGESYMNFGVSGVILISALLGWYLTRWFYSVDISNVATLNNYTYLIFFVALIQVFRDGLSSFIVFTIVPNIPLLLVLLLHFIYKERLKISKVREVNE